MIQKWGMGPNYYRGTCREEDDGCIASAKRRLKSNHFSNNLPDQTEDVLYNPINPINPDSRLRLKAHLKTKTTYRQKQQ
jgi:hypothetical protein